MFTEGNIVKKSASASRFNLSIIAASCAHCGLFNLDLPKGFDASNLSGPIVAVNYVNSS